MPTPKQKYVKAKFNKTIGQFKSGETYEIGENLAKYWKRYVDVVTTTQEKEQSPEKKGSPKKAKNKAILDNKENK